MNKELTQIAWMIDAMQNEIARSLIWPDKWHTSSSTVLLNYTHRRWFVIIFLYNFYLFSACAPVLNAMATSSWFLNIPTRWEYGAIALPCQSWIYQFGSVILIQIVFNFQLQMDQKLSTHYWQCQLLFTSLISSFSYFIIQPGSVKTWTVLKVKLLDRALCGSTSTNTIHTCFSFSYSVNWSWRQVRLLFDRLLILFRYGMHNTGKDGKEHGHSIFL